MDGDLDGTVSWRALLRETEQRLEGGAQEGDSVREARWIVEDLLDVTGAELNARLDDLATVRGVAKLDRMVDRRLAGEPIQYVLGHWAFRSLDLLVDQRVLVPRPETEVVAGLAVDELRRLNPDGGTALDLGTGSGAIGLSIAWECPGSSVVLTDASADALSVARANLTGLGMAGGNVEVYEGSWFQAIPAERQGDFDVIVSNPPYVRTGDALPSSVLDWEPDGALFAGRDGLDDVREIIEAAPVWLRPTGSVILEMDPGQVGEAVDLGRRAGFVGTVHKDLAGLDRAVVLRRHGGV